jgi:hypothetical protein
MLLDLLAGVCPSSDAERELGCAPENLFQPRKRFSSAAHKSRAPDGSRPFPRFTEIRESGATAKPRLRLSLASRWSAPSCTTTLE